MSNRRPFGGLIVLAACAALAFVAGCGGGGGGAAPPPPPPPPPPLTITTTSLANAVVGKAYNQTLQATGGTAPFIWSLAGGSDPLPGGLTLNDAGVISGTPTARASVNIIVQVRDSGTQSRTKTLPLFVSDVLAVTTTAVPAGNVGVLYVTFLQAAGGFGGYTWSITSGSLPAGLTLGAGGLLQGQPTAAGTFNLTVRVTDQGSPAQSATQQLSLVIGNTLVLNTPQPLPVGVVTRAYSQPLQAFGGTKPYTWSVAQGILPTGLTLDPASGVISGMPSQSGSFLLLAEVTDSSSPAQTATQVQSLTINPVLSIVSESLPDGVLMSGYAGVVQIVGGVPPYTATLTAGALPDGLSLSGFVITGAPTKLGTFSFTIQVTDSSAPPMVASKALSIRVNSRLAFSPATPPVGLQGQPYAFTFAASGGLPPFQWTVLVPVLPPGLALNPASGVLGGTPGGAFDSDLVLQVQDSSSPPQQAIGVSHLRVAGLLRISTTALPTVKTGAAMNIQLGLTGGTGPFTWNITSGGLPAGLTFDAATATIQGTVALDTSATFTVTVSDPGPPSQSDTRTLTLTTMSLLGRNDTIATATPLSNGTYQASISPFVDPPTATSGNPDTDYYRLTANAGAIVTVIIKAQRLTPPSPLDSVIEIVDSNGKRFATCAAPNSGGDGPYTFPCVNDDDLRFNTTDSRLVFQASSSATGPLTFFVHVLDFRGDARPDFLYTITISGAN